LSQQLGDTASAAVPATRRRRSPSFQAIVLRRSDFRESSRIVTVLSREHGRVTGLAKGAHRPDSPFLGHLDFLAEVQATFSADRGGLRLLERAVLVRERRSLREPTRFLAASHLADLADVALPAERIDPAAFDLLIGGLNLLERCPGPAIGHVVLGLELRFLELLGALPDLQNCSVCGGPLQAAFCHDESLGLVCREHATPPRRAVPTDGLRLLRELQSSTGRQWPGLANTAPTQTCSHLPAAWLFAATEHRSRLRGLLFSRC
jgi:DNA repair protein RecO (recombination protein O)